MDFAVPANFRGKLKESETKDRHLDLAMELKNMEVTIIPIIICALRCHKRIDTRTVDLKIIGPFKLLHNSDRSDN